MWVRGLGRHSMWIMCVVLAATLLLPGASSARTAAEIDASVNAALARFNRQVSGSQAVLKMAKGVLVLADVFQAGIGIGGEYGEGALRIGGKTASYYSIAAGSIGFQLGAQKKDIILLFLQDAALAKFRAKKGWQVGVDGSVVLINVGAHGSVDTTKLNKPIMGFVVGQKGLMYNLTLEGAKISPITR